ncbi:hypothetical protein [Devosia sp. RR2S18]|uniref:hypothetical protein n=1 Tax=Devosia rhizosphaerae TaxID=3049774 RepID=UPI00254099E7|nr:hypothetical protein [Devosia sp. RR2S18]WIJ23420.1 hypothetical protein QOV41_09990 [Devosia sp. RR2S18]
MEVGRDTARRAGTGNEENSGAGQSILPSGLYGVRFRYQGKQASGVVAIHGDSFAGGDSGMAYYGKLTRSGAQLRATVTTLRHTDTGGVALLGSDNLEFVADGQPTGSGAIFSGDAPHTGQRFEFSLTGIRTPGLSI